MRVSLFRNFNQVVEDLELDVILEQIRSGKYKNRIQALRDLIRLGKDDEYKAKKKSLPAFSPSGVFEGGRKLDFLKEYSGCLILDIDHLQQDQLISAKTKAADIPFTHACFISPGGQGLKILVKVLSLPAAHKQTWEQLKDHYEQQLNLPVDPSGKDITRLCFVSWDEFPYLNPSSAIFKPQINMVAGEIEKVVRQIEDRRLDITSNYNDWIHIAFALIDALGEQARDYFHRISKFNPEYDPAKCNTQFNKCLASTGEGITINSFFFLAKEHMIVISGTPPLLEERGAGGEVRLVESGLGGEAEQERGPGGEVRLDEKGQGGEAKDKRKKNRIYTIERFLLNHYQFRYNTVTSQLELRKLPINTPTPPTPPTPPIPPIPPSPWHPLTDYLENSLLRSILHNNIRCSISTLRSILFSDFCEKFDPFIDYFSRLPPWDRKTDYIRQLSETIVTSNANQWHDCFKKWLVASVASVLDPEIINHTAIIFSGPQGIGKTSWLINLCPLELKDYLFSGTINPNNKDTLSHLSECMYINMDELENMNRTEIGVFKEMITKSVIRIRRAYGHHNEKLYRRASFMGSVNSSQFLSDTTGSRRFLCFEVNQIDYRHSVNLDAVYSQAYDLYRQGFRFYFVQSEIRTINAGNEQFQIRSLEEELLLTYFEPVPVSFNCKSMTAAGILSRLAQKAALNLSVNLGASISLGKALKKHGFNRFKKDGIYVWAIKEK